MKMKKAKKLLSTLLALCMILSLLPMTALAVIPPLTVGIGGDYATLTDALAASEDGATITLLNDMTESVSYTVATGKTITIDGGGYTLTGVAGDSSIALSLSGNGNIILKNINLSGGVGGSTNSTASTGLYITDTLNVQSIGTVTSTGGTDKYSCGLYHNGSGAVNLTGATGQKYGVNNNSIGTVNVNAATGTAGIIENYGVFNNGSGTVNVATSTGSNATGIGVVNWGTGTVNVTTAVGSAYGVYNSSSGTVNAANISGSTSGTVNTGANVATITLNKGADASCVLDSITVAASGDTTVGTLPSVYKDGVAGEWYTNVAKDALFSGTTVTAATTLYSTYYTSVSGRILSNLTPPAGLAATLQLKDSSGNNVGNTVTADTDGTYTISNVPAGTGYTILATMSGYADGTITAFDVADTNITALNLTLHSLTVGTGCNTLSDALASAGDGDTVTLNSDITECAAYTGTAGKTVTIDGQGYTVTGAAISNSVALTLSGEGTVILEDLTLQGGDSGEAFALSVGLQVNNSLDVRSLGTVAVKGGTAQMSYGLNHSGTGTVDVTEASAVGTSMGVGVVNNSSGTVNISTATCNDAFGTGAVNSGAGTINVTTATGGAEGANNQIGGTINVTTATGSQFGVSNMNNGTINVTTVSSSGTAVENSGGGTVNAGTITAGSVSGTANTGTAVAAVTLNVGIGASCVLDSITVAASGSTTIGTLPNVFKDGAYSKDWYTNATKSSLFGSSIVTGATTLYSDYYEAFATITKDSTTTYYETLTEALTAAVDGDTITLLGDITECATYIGTAGKTVTIDGQNHTVTGAEGSESIALSLGGEGTVILKNLTLRGGTYTSVSGTSIGLRVGGTLDIRSDGTVSVYGGTTAANGFGLANYSVGTVDVTTASASGSNIGIGVANYTTGTVNVSTAEGSGIQGTGVFNQSSGTVNVTTATGIFYGVLNQSTGTVNVATATATGLGGTAVSNGSGTVNAGTITGSTVGSGTINTGTDVATVTLKAGTGTSCVLSSITVAASGDTTIGALPSVYKDGAYSNNWYTDNAKTTAFSGTTVTGATTLLSDYYEVASINTAAIAGVTAPVKGATPTSSITDTTEYTATISWSPADATFAASTAYTATITITPKIGYTLTGVAENYFTVAGAKTTSNIANSGVVTAVFPATASSGSTGSVGDTSSSSSTITITTEGSVTTGTASLTGSTSGGSQTVSVPSNTMTSLTKAAQKAETSGNLAIAQIDTGSDTGLENVGVTIPGTQFDSFASGTDAALQFSTGIGSVTFSSDAVGTIGAAGSGDVAFNMSVVSTSSLSAAQQATVGDRPVYSLSITVGDTTVSEFSATVTVMLPYTLQDGEKPNAIVVYYVDASGDLQMMQGAYDETTGMVTFETTHFSYYFISYNEVAFTDVAETAWYADAVTFLAARGITTGTTATTFSPNMTLTRGQYVTLLLHAYGISADTNATDNFADAGNTYYTGYLAAAKELGISSGTGDNMFAPDKAITRQEMLTMLYHALKVLDELPSGDSGKTLSDFSDTGDIANWAQDAMAFFVETGAISGNGGKLSPTDTTTRAELAQVLYNLLTR